MGDGCHNEQKDTHHDSNGSKSSAIIDEDIEEVTFEAAGGDHEITKTITCKNKSGATRKDAKLTCNSIPLRAPDDQESVTFLSTQQHCFSANAYNMIRGDHLSQPIETDDTCSQHTAGTSNASTIDSSCQGYVKPSAKIPEDAKESLSRTVQDAAASDDECVSIASSNTETYDETDCRDFGVNDEGAQEAFTKTADDKLDVLVDVSYPFPSLKKRNSCNIAEEKGSPAGFLSTNIFSTLLEESENNSYHVHRNGHSFPLNDNQFQEEIILPAAQIKSPETNSGSTLSDSKIGLINAYERSSDNYNTVLGSKVTIPRESSEICNALKRISIQGDTKCNSSKSLNGKRISTATGVVYEDNASDTESSKGSNVIQMFRSSEPSEVDGKFSDEVCHKVVSNNSEVAIVSESQFQNALKVKSNHNKSKVVVNGKRNINSSGMISEGKVSFPESSQCSTTIQTVLLSDKSKAPTVIPSSSRHRNFDSGTSSLCFNEFMASSKLPPGSTLLTKRGIYCVTNTEWPFACGYCGKAFKTRRSVCRHIRNRHEEKPLDSGTSSSCFSEFMASSKLPPGSTLVNKRGIYRIKDREKPFACGYCGKAYNVKHSVYKHIKNRHSGKPYSCEFCGKRFSTPRFLKDHVLTHSQEKPYTCDQCGKSFHLEKGLRQHKSVHSEERLFRCKECNKSFKFKSGLKRHSELHNKDQEREGGHSCNICKKTFTTAHGLKYHMMIHTGEKPLKCSACDKQFRQRGQLQKHMNTHSGVKMKSAKPCSVCGKIVSVSAKANHMRMHSGEKPFECNVCGKRFPKKENLEGHMRSHTGEKPFACSRCDKRFALYSNMVTHKTKCTGL